jgi:ubiquinone/menaquinone biosynthesis C-methylase UbiE
MTLQRDPEEHEITHLHDFADFAGARVLEIGCGEGRLTWRYAASAGRVAGIDSDFNRLSVAPGDCPPTLRSRVAFALARAENLPFPRETFDLALLAWSL